MITQALDVAILTPETPAAGVAASDPSPVDSRCPHRYDNGTRCRLRGSQSQLGLCPRHFRLKVAGLLPQAPDDSADLSKDLLPSQTRFSSQDLREFLARLLILVTKGRISSRRASVLAYVATQLLHSHSVVKRR